MGGAIDISYFEREQLQRAEARLEERIRELEAEVERMRDTLVEVADYQNTSMLCKAHADDTELDTEYRKGARAALRNVTTLALLGLEPSNLK